ncbi:MAG: YceD family protein [Saprospiraceae bacterium]
MSVNRHFSIPFEGLKDGMHSFDFIVDDSFFSAFEMSPIKSAKIEMHCTLEKKPKVSNLTLIFNGFYYSSCDRCLENIQIPLTGSHLLHVKVQSRMAGTEEEDVIFIEEHTASIDLKQQLYELICLAMPIQNVYECENQFPRPCNSEVLKVLAQYSSDDKIGNVFDTLKNINFED